MGADNRTQGATDMMTFKIKTPIWKEKAVGLAIDKLKQAWNAGERTVAVEIEYTDQSGSRVYPHLYSFDLAKRKECRRMLVGGKTEVLIVPIYSMGIAEIR